jgi:hypothetical protein
VVQRRVYLCIAILLAAMSLHTAKSVSADDLTTRRTPALCWKQKSREDFRWNSIARLRNTDSIEIALPQGYVVDDLPPPVNVDYGFASYHEQSGIFRKQIDVHANVRGKGIERSGGQSRGP